tara:strand:- start:3285 stop:3437 length:153 start_codon:yes stop_codon:yes gene_type:complete
VVEVFVTLPTPCEKYSPSQQSLEYDPSLHKHPLLEFLGEELRPLYFLDII